MKTPRDVMRAAMIEARQGSGNDLEVWGSVPDWLDAALDALDAAGYHITPNLPPNTAVNITTDEHGHIVQFKPHSETQKGQPQ